MKSDTVRMVIGFAVVILIMVVWQVFMPKPKPAARPVAQPAAVEPLPAQPAAPQPTPAQPARPMAPAPETTAVVENDFIRVTVTSSGAALKSIYLKRYRADLVQPGSSLLGSPALLGGDSVRLLGLTAGERQVRLTYALGPDSVTKVFALGDDYTLDCSLKFSGPARPVDLDASAGIDTTEANAKEDLSNFHVYAREGSKVHQLSAGALRKKPFSVAADWAGLKSKYFLLAVVARSGTVRVDGVALPDNRCGLWVAAAPETTGTAFKIYLGPIEYNRLRSFGLGFENVVSLGWMKPIALAILWVLHLFYGLLRNWGVAIVCFSILMKVAFYPLTRVQTRQMRQMQLLQPKINELKEKYKSDPQMLNQETMRLYRVYKINPLSGCLPMLVQMPVFFALYAVLRNFIELRGAGFILWLKDLSQPDTLFGHVPSAVPVLGGYAIGLLPILMGVSFIVQNMLTSTDKKNWAMTILFPVFITAIFLNLSSGLQLYWFIYNVLSILESLVAARGGKLWRRMRNPAEASPEPAPKA